MWSRLLKWSGSSIGSAVLTVAGAGLVAAIVTVAYVLHPPDSIFLRAQSISRITATDSASMQLTGYARELSVQAVTGTVDVALVTPKTDCQQLAGELHGTCDGSTVGLDTSLDLMWAKPATPVLVNMDSLATFPQVVLSTIPADENHGIQLTFANGVTPRVCLNRSLDSARVTIGPSRSVVTVKPSVSPSLATCEGLVLHLRSQDPGGRPGFALDGVETLSTTTAGKQMQIDASSLSLTLRSNGQNPPVEDSVEIDSDTPIELTTMGVPPDLAVYKGLQVPAATRVVSAGAERLQTAWSRYPQFTVVPSIGTALVTLAVVAAVRLLGNRPNAPGQPHSNGSSP